MTLATNSSTEQSCRDCHSDSCLWNKLYIGLNTSCTWEAVNAPFSVVVDGLGSILERIPYAYHLLKNTENETGTLELKGLVPTIQVQVNYIWNVLV